MSNSADHAHERNLTHDTYPPELVEAVKRERYRARCDDARRWAVRNGFGPELVDGFRAVHDGIEHGKAPFTTGCNARERQ